MELGYFLAETFKKAKIMIPHTQSAGTPYVVCQNS
jgi:hypothetical protein